MTVKLHVGYIGKTREGKRVEIVKYIEGARWPWLDSEENELRDDGSYFNLNNADPRDIIGPWTEPGPWIGWNGGECPVHPETVVDYVWFDPCVDFEDTGVTKGRKAGDRVAWGQVVKYRVIKEHKEPREFWISNNDYKAYDTLDEFLELDLCEGKHGYIHVREATE